jgi:hypothetical protein
MTQIKDIAITKIIAEDSDFLLMQNPTTGETYKITKADLLARANVPVVTDPYFSNVVLLLHGDEVDTSSSIINSGNSNYSVIITNNSSVRNSNAKGVFGNSLKFINPSSLNCLSSSFNVGNQDCTIELFFNVDPARGNLLFEMRPDSTNGNYPQLSFDENTLAMYYDSLPRISVSRTIASNTWYYIALKKIGTLTELWFEGSKIGQFATGNWSSSGRIKIGENAYYAPGTSFNGHIDEFRFTLGTARDVSVIPTSPFPNS